MIAFGTTLCETARRRRFKELAAEHVADDVTVIDLAATLGVPIRTL